MRSVDDCIFCKIVSGDTPCFKVTEDDLTLVFLDLFPVNEGHTLVIPKEHFHDLFEIDGPTLAAVAAASLRVAHAIDTALGAEGLGVFQLNRAAAGQTVFHYHMHLLPRNTGDPLALHSRVRGEDSALRETAERIRRALSPR
ncbi:MAG: HIT family protein [Myxococcota bacterium]